MTHDPPLRSQVDRLVRSAIARTAEEPSLTGFHQVLVTARDRLDQPMRVAIVGLIKAGKSTVMNALLGEALVATGAVETTFNVNWLRYGDEPAITVHFKDGRPPESGSIASLAGLTARADERLTELLEIRHIEVAYPNELLRTLNLIDTPGLYSVHKEDSRNTRNFLALYGAEMTRVTEAEAAAADAVLYLFSRGLADADQATVEEFIGPVVGSATPINAIGVLTRIDSYWPDRTDPLDGARQIVNRLRANPRVNRIFYTIEPVCGLLALGAQTLTDEESDALRTLADELPVERLERLLLTVERFRERPYDDVPVPPEMRARLADRLGLYGVWLACERLRAGVSSRNELSGELWRASGAENLLDLIRGHFGNRAYLIKLSTVLWVIERASFDERRRLGDDPARWAIVDEIAGGFERIEAEAHAFRELRALRACYEGRLTLTDAEQAQLLAVTGEHGGDCAARLGLDPDTPVDAMLAVANERLAAWRVRANDVLGSDRATVAAAEVITHSYERIAYHLAEARRLMTEARRHLLTPD